MDIGELKISSLLKEKYIELNLKELNKPKVILELVRLIGKSSRAGSEKALSKAMLERERLGSTAIGNGVAIPHLKSDSMRKFVVAFARKSQGLNFESLDGGKTYIFFILASPKKKVGPHLKILANISRLVKDKFNVELLRKAKNKKEILKIIAAAEAFKL